MSLKSTQGPIDVFLCPEDSSGACSPVSGSSPAKSSADPSPVPTVAQPADQSKAGGSAAALQASSSSPASTSSTVTAASQQDSSSLAVGSDSGECSCFNLWTFDVTFYELFNNEESSICFQILILVLTRCELKKKKQKSINPKRHTVISRGLRPLPS